ncbi:MAG: hypothetical protein ACXV0U_09270 [Kineosporiaceae bacterium]
MSRTRGVVAVAAIATAGMVVAFVPTSTQAASAPPAPRVRPHVQKPLTSTDMPAGSLVVHPEGTAALVDPNTQCGAAAADPVPDGQPIVVSIPPGPNFTVGQIPASWWKTPPYGDAGWQLQLRGFMWLNPLAQRAFLDGQTGSLNVLVDQVLAFHRQNPDPGTSTSTTTANANAWGWDEGTALRRLGAENCLYSVTKDARLAAVMAEDVNVEYGTRYYGPPLYAVHNHGVMADLAVIRAADLVGRRDWQTRSINRLAANAPLAWTSLGTTHEQSSSYHVFNVALWGEVADMMQAHNVAAATVQHVRDLDARASRVSPWLTEPNGRLVVLGDSSADPGFTRSKWTARTFRDNQAGFAMGKWSWTDLMTTYYTIRYGPPRWAHGQQERAGITWSTRNRRVLVGPGRAPYDPAGNYQSWARNPPSHNVAAADRRTLNTRASVSVTSTTFRASWHAWTTVDLLFGVRHTRWYGIVRDTSTLTVQDTYDGKAAFHQFWHLDPGWRLLSRSSDGKRITFQSGIRFLTVTTTGSTSVLRGVTRPVAGWNFPGNGTRVQAYEIQVSAAGTATTTFRVT